MVFVLQTAHPGAGHSEFDMDMISMMNNMKTAAEAPWYWAIVKPGDCIYIPAGEKHTYSSQYTTNHFGFSRTYCTET